MASADPGAVPGVAHLLVELARSRPATLGAGRLIRLDGPAGSGKTTLAEAVASLLPGSRVVHMDDLYDGWDGLPRVADQLDALLLPLAAGQPGSYRRYDWLADAYAETVVVPPGDLVVLEGVGSGSRAHAGLATVTAWVWAPEEVRRHVGSSGTDRSSRGGGDSGCGTRTTTSPARPSPRTPTCWSTGSASRHRWYDHPVAGPRLCVSRPAQAGKSPAVSPRSITSTRRTHDVPRVSPCIHPAANSSRSPEAATAPS